MAQNLGIGEKRDETTAARPKVDEILIYVNVNSTYVVEMKFLHYTNVFSLVKRVPILIGFVPQNFL